MRSKAWMVVGWMLAAVAAVVPAAGRAQDLGCCDFPCRLLDPLGQDPLWTGRVDALLLWRDAPQSQPLFDYFDGGSALNASQFQSGMAAGPRFTLFRHTGDMGAIEFNYLRVQSFTAARSLPEEIAGYRDAPPPYLFCCNEDTPRDSASGNLSSSLQSAEVNRRFPTDGRLGWLMGFRWVEWNDALGVTSATSLAQVPFTNSYLSRTSNDLYGMQVGADSILYGLGRPFRIEGIGKAGVFYNDARQASSFSTTEQGVPALAVSTSVGRAAFVGEVGLTAVYDIFDRLSLRAGYTAFWLDGLALAPAQYGVNQLCPNLPIVGVTDTGGGVVVQGLSLGLEARW